MAVRWFVSGSDGLTIALVALLIMTINRGNAFGQTGAAPSPVLETVIARDADVGVDEPAPNSGGGDSTGYYFFGRRSKTPNFKGIFRKRILHKGAAIGVQPQPQDEVYYVLSGTGDLTIDGVPQNVGARTAILKRPGNSYGLRQVGNDDFVLIVSSGE